MAGRDAEDWAEIELGFHRRKQVVKKKSFADASIDEEPPKVDEHPHRNSVEKSDQVHRDATRATLLHLEDGKAMLDHSPHHGGELLKHSNSHGRLDTTIEDFAHKANAHAQRNPELYQTSFEFDIKDPTRSMGGLFDETMRRLDADGDGVFNISDLDDLMEADVDEVVLEEEDNYKPIFIVVQMLIAVGFWLVESIRLEGLDFWKTAAGLETVVERYTSQNLTAVKVSEDFEECINHTWEVWRWLSYQYTHTNASHIAMNTLIILLAGLPLEMFQGHIRTFLLWNSGVIAGAFASMAWNVRKTLVGMSAGCYTLLGVHFSEIIMNWKESRFRYPKIALLIVIVGVDILNIHFTQTDSTYAELAGNIIAVTSHSAHVGGFATGLLLGILISRNLIVTRCEKALMWLAGFGLVAITAYHLIVMAEWPPRSNTWDESEPYCWISQVWCQEFFGDVDFHCVRCGDIECIRRWQQFRMVEQIDYEICVYEPTLGGFYNGTPPGKDAWIGRSCISAGR